MRLRGLFAFTLLMGLTAFLAGCSAVPGVGASSTYSLVGLWLVIASTLGLLVGCGGPSLNASQGGSFPPTVTATPAVSTAVALQFVQQPTARTASAQVLDVITPFPQVEAVDQSGRRVTSFTGAVTLTLSAPAGVTLLGTVTRNAVAGVATFDDLRLSQAGVSYTLQASSGSLQTGTSIAFTTAPLPLAFSTLQTYAAGSFPQGTAVADVNADKIPDLVAADFNDAVSVFLGNGDGTFRSRQTFVTDTFSIEVSVADFNGDTKPDLSVLNNYSASVLLGNGDGTFGAPRQIADSEARPVSCTRVCRGYAAVARVVVPPVAAKSRRASRGVRWFSFPRRQWWL